MGTTATALRAGNCRIGYSMVIEGFEYILTDSGAMNPVVLAYAATEWSQALPGLEVRGPIRERLEPWARSLSIPTITVRVKQDRADIFGKAVFKSKPSYESRLTATFEPAADGSGTLNVKDTAAAPTDGVLYAGKARVAYTSKGAGTFAIGAAGWGAMQPFAADGANHFGEPAALPGGQNWDAAPPMRITDVPTTWIGRKVAVRIHRVVGGVWDTVAQSQLEFAGRISGISDDPNGFTVLACEDLRANIRDAVLLENQWVGYAKKGLRLVAGTKFYAYEQFATIVATVYTPDENLYGPFTVVASGATGDDEIDEGVYEYDVIVGALGRWLQNAGASLEGDWSMAPTDTAGTTRVMTKAEFAAGTINAEISLACNRKEALRFLGYTDTTSATSFELDADYVVTPPARGTATSLRPELLAPEAPRVASVIRPLDYASASSQIGNNYGI